MSDVTTATNTTGPATTALAASTIAPRLAMTTSAPATTMGPIVLTVPEVSAQAIEDSSVAPAYEYSASMPVVSGLDPRIADPVNGQIRRLYQAWIDANISAVSADAEGRTYGLEIEQEVTLATEQLLSLGVVWSKYNSCAASAEGARVGDDLRSDGRVAVGTRRSSLLSRDPVRALRAVGSGSD